MTNESCEPFADLLIEYADGELSQADARRVADHLAGCPECHAELRLLQRSLDLARAVWEESASRAPSPRSYPVRPRRRRIRTAVGLAACAAALLLMAGVWLFSRGGTGEQVERVAEIEPTDSLPPLEDLDIETFIAREGRSARLAAATKLLATQPGLEDYVKQAGRYLSEAYGETVAAGSVVPATDPTPTKEPKS